MLSVNPSRDPNVSVPRFDIDFHVLRASLNDRGERPKSDDTARSPPSHL